MFEDAEFRLYQEAQVDAGVHTYASRSFYFSSPISSDLFSVRLIMLPEARHLFMKLSLSSQFSFSAKHRREWRA
jgi:hypothetical protein